jgi:MFS family permease
LNPKLRQYPHFVRFWLASTVSDFGTYVTGVALSVLVLVSLGGSPLDQGLVNAARWAPYLLFGLLAGIWVDRWRRRTVLIAGDLGRALVLAALCVGSAAGALDIPAVMVLMFVFGMLAMFSDAAYQSFLPQLVPRRLLIRANARLQQSDTVAQTTGSALAGGLVAVVTAPFALLIDALTYLASGIVLMTLQGQPARTRPGADAGTAGQMTVRQRVAEGLRWVYGHAQLGPLAWSSHAWFIGSAILGAVLPVLILKDLGLGAAGLGLVMSSAGVGAVIGALLSARLGERWGTGRAMVASRLLQPAAIVLVALSPLVAGTGPGPAFILAASGQFLFATAMGVEGPLEMGYRQAVTPDGLIARMSATMRSVNRGMIVVGAPLGGFIASAASTAAALWAAVSMLLLAAVVLRLSAFRHASVEHQQLADEDSLPAGVSED